MSGDEHPRLRALVKGQVQGVFFRDYTWSHATRLGLTGWVRNLRDGRTVEVVAEGPRSSLKELVARLRRGPAGAHVEHVDVSWEAAPSELDSFEVR